MHCPAPLSQVRIQPQSRLLSGRRKKALFVSPSPDTASKRAKGIYETPRKFRVEKTGEISRNLRFSRFFSSGSILTVRHGRGRRILNPCLRQYLRKPIVQSCADAANCMAICGAFHFVCSTKKKSSHAYARRLSFLARYYKIDPYHKFFRNRSMFQSQRIDLSLGDDGSCT